MSKKIIDLNSKEFKKELIDFFIYTKELSEKFYKKNNVKYIDYFDFKKNNNLDNSYLFLSNLYKGAGASYLFYEKYPDFEKDFTDVFYFEKEKLKKRKKLYQEFLKFLKEFFLEKMPNKTFFEDYKIDKKDFKYFKSNLIERFIEGYYHTSRILEPLFYLYLKEKNILQNYISYFGHSDIKIFKIYSPINPIPYYFNMDKFYNLIIIGNIFYTLVVNYLTEPDFIYFKKIKPYYFNNRLNYFLYDYESILEFQTKFTFIVNLDNYILEKLNDDKIVKYIRENRIKGIINLLTFNQIKNIIKDLESNFEKINLAQIHKWI